MSDNNSSTGIGVGGLLAFALSIYRAHGNFDIWHILIIIGNTILGWLYIIWTLIATGFHPFK